jgi:hypothetical protein
MEMSSGSLKMKHDSIQFQPTSVIVCMFCKWFPNLSLHKFLFRKFIISESSSTVLFTKKKKIPPYMSPSVILHPLHLAHDYVVKALHDFS